MTPQGLRTLASVHSVVAWTAVVVTVGAAASAALRWPWKGRVLPTVGALSTALLTATVALGLGLDSSYRRMLRQKLFVQSQRIGYLFERKEHFAFGAVMFAVLALAALGASALCARRRGASYEEASKVLATVVARAYMASAVFAALAAVASAVVAHYRTF